MQDTSDGKDYKIVIRKGAAKQLPAATQVTTSTPIAVDMEKGRGVPEVTPLQDKDELIEQARELVKLFYRLFQGVQNYEPQTRAIGQASSLIAQYGEQQARYIVNFSHSAAPDTNFKPQTFGGIMNYAPKAAAQYEQIQLERRRNDQRIAEQTLRKEVEEAHEREQEATRQRSESFFKTLPSDEQERLLRHYRERAFEQNPYLRRCEEDMIERHTMRLILATIVPPAEPTSADSQPEQVNLFE